MDHKIFISYARDDYYDQNNQVIPNNIIQRIEDVLNDNDYSYWIDRENIHAAADFVDRIIDAIKKSKVFILVLTENSRDAYFVTCELRKAVAEGKKIILIKAIDEIPESIEFLLTSHVEYIDYFISPEQAIHKLIRSLNVIFDDSLRKLKDILEELEKKRDTLDVNILEYRSFQEKLQNELLVKSEERRCIDTEISLREKSIELLKEEENKTEKSKGEILLEIAKVQVQIEEIVGPQKQKEKILTLETEQNSSTDIDASSIIDSEDLKDDSIVVKTVKIKEENAESIDAENEHNSLEEELIIPKPDFTEDGYKFMMGYYDQSKNKEKKEN